MDHQCRCDNLERCCRELRDAAGAYPAPCQAHCECACRIAEELPLSHGTTARAFTAIAAGGRLLSHARLVEHGMREPLPDTAPDIVLGTNDAVFLFAAPFRYPDMECGLLFRRSLEDARTDGEASPFDSGELVNTYTLPPDAPNAVEFLRRHRLPLPGHRELLRDSLELLFDDPWDYVADRPRAREGPIGLTGGDDHRRWTHEVRIPGEVALDDHLLAVFVARSLAKNAGVRATLDRLTRRGVAHVLFDTPGGGVFEGLKNSCIEYVRAMIEGQEAPP